MTVLRKRRASRWILVDRAELGTIAAVFVLALGLLAFNGLAEEALEGDTEAFDRAVLLAMRNDAGNPAGPQWLQGAARDITSLGSNVVLGLVCFGVIGYLTLSGARGAAVLVFASVSSGYALVTLLKEVFGRARPDLVPHVVEAFSASFPSGHATLSAVTYLTLGALMARVQAHSHLKAYILAVAIGATVLVGISRVYLGVHWPTDVLAGWCVGSAWAMVCWVVAVWFQRRGQVEQDVERRAAS